MSGWGGADGDRDAEEESAGNFAQYDYLSRIIQGAISGAAWNLTGSGDTPGVYRTRAVEIEWSKHTPPDPFADGNGRTARAACYFVVCRWLEFEPASKPALPDLIAQQPIKYRKCLETADAHWARHKNRTFRTVQGFSGGS